MIYKSSLVQWHKAAWFSGTALAFVSPIGIRNKCLLNICADLLPGFKLVQFSTAFITI